MKFTVLILVFLCLFSFNLKAQHPPVFEGMTTDTVSLDLNDWPVNLVKYSYGGPNIDFIAIHDNEDTGVKAAFEYIRFSGGSIVDCQYGGGRNFQFIYNDEEFQTDPNGIYTIPGIIKGLEKYSWAEPEVVKLLDQASKKILKLYHTEKAPYIFALHNNADGGFGIPSYLKGYELEHFADSLHINFQMDPDDLILVTDVALFNGLKKENVNVILQSKNAPDDGSLSYYAMQQHIPYINVEVQHGHIQEHLMLIETAVKVMKETLLLPTTDF